MNSEGTKLLGCIMASVGQAIGLKKNETAVAYSEKKEIFLASYK